jgi:hypothetical protein
MSRDRKEKKPVDGDFEKAVLEAMRGSWILPQTPEEVRQAEEGLGSNPVDLPVGLANPYSVLDKPSRKIRLGRPLETDRDLSLEQNLAQVAREGGEIPPQVKEQMRKDREAAENEKDG